MRDMMSETAAAALATDEACEVTSAALRDGGGGPGGEFVCEEWLRAHGERHWQHRRLWRLCTDAAGGLSGRRRWYGCGWGHGWGGGLRTGGALRLEQLARDPRTLGAN